MHTTILRLALSLTLLMFAGCSQEPAEQEEKVITENLPAQAQTVSAANPSQPPASPAPTAEPPPANTRPQTSFDKDFGALTEGDAITFSTPGGERYAFTITDAKELGSGNTHISGKIDGCEDCTMTVVTGKSGAFGRIHTPETTYQLTLRDGETVLLDTKDPNNIIDPGFADDMVTPPGKQQAAEQETPLAEETAAPSAEPLGEQVTADNIIDVMVVYTPGLVEDYPGDLLQTRIDYLIALSNTAYQTSDIDISLRLVHSQQFDYSDNTTNGTALDAITDHLEPFTEIETLRTAHGADLVVLLRSYDYPDHGGCGMAWVLGDDSSFSDWDANWAFSTVSDGSEQVGIYTYYCSDLSFPHELGHNMGAAHDRANAGVSPTFPYGFGYGIDGSFGTIMSYLDPEVERFSNPEQIACNGPSGLVACGVDENSADSANNTLALNNAAPSIAGFRATQHSADVDNDGTIDTEDTIRSLRISAGFPSAEPVDPYEDVDGDGKIGVAEAIHSLRQL